MKNVNKLSNVELERIGIIVEELGETCQVLGKIIRHGLESKNPIIENSLTNRQLLEKEIGDVYNAVDMMAEENMVSKEKILKNADIKSASIEMWLHYISNHPVRKKR